MTAAITGSLYLCTLLVPQVDGPPVETATATDIRAFLMDHTDELRLYAVGGVAMFALVVIFAVALARIVRNALPGSMLADAIVAAGALVGVWHWVVTATTSATLVQALDGTPLARVNDQTLVAWYSVTNIGHFFADLGMVPIALLVGAFSAASLRAGLLPRWIAWAGLVIAAGGMVGTIGVGLAVTGLADVWFVGIFGWVLWVIAVVVTLGLRSRAVRSAVGVSARVAEGA